MTEDKYRDLFMEAVREVSCQKFKIGSHSRQDQNFIPDVSFSGNGVDGWVEVKYCDKVPRSLGSIRHWTIGQQEFLIERGDAGSGACYLLVGLKDARSGGRSVMYHWTRLREARTAKFPDVCWAMAVGSGHIVSMARQFVRYTGRGAAVPTT